jgi:hypothetical protein
MRVWHTSGIHQKIDFIVPSRQVNLFSTVSREFGILLEFINLCLTGDIYDATGLVLVEFLSHTESLI